MGREPGDAKVKECERRRRGAAAWERGSERREPKKKMLASSVYHQPEPGTATKKPSESYTCGSARWQAGTPGCAATSSLEGHGDKERSIRKVVNTIMTHERRKGEAQCGGRRSDETRGARLLNVEVC